MAALVTVCTGWASITCAYILHQSIRLSEKLRSIACQMLSWCAHAYLHVRTCACRRAYMPGQGGPVVRQVSQVANFDEEGVGGGVGVIVWPAVPLRGGQAMSRKFPGKVPGTSLRLVCRVAACTRHGIVSSRSGLTILIVRSVRCSDGCKLFGN